MFTPQKAFFIFTSCGVNLKSSSGYAVEGVAKTRAEYEKCLEVHSQSKARFEEQKSKGSKRVDEFKDRYQKACKKLHVIHNVNLFFNNLNFRQEVVFRKKCLLPILPP